MFRELEEREFLVALNSSVMWPESFNATVMRFIFGHQLHHEGSPSWEDIIDLNPWMKDVKIQTLPNAREDEPGVFEEIYDDSGENLVVLKQIPLPDFLSDATADFSIFEVYRKAGESQPDVFGAFLDRLGQLWKRRYATAPGWLKNHADQSPHALYEIGDYALTAHLTYWDHPLGGSHR